MSSQGLFQERILNSQTIELNGPLIDLAKRAPQFRHLSHLIGTSIHFDQCDVQAVTFRGTTLQPKSYWALLKTKVTWSLNVVE